MPRRRSERGQADQDQPRSQQGFGSDVPMGSESGAAGLDDPAVQEAIQRGAMRRAQADMRAGIQPGSRPIVPPATEGRMANPMTGMDQQPTGDMGERVDPKQGNVPGTDDSRHGPGGSGMPGQQTRITKERLNKAMSILNEYKKGKATVDRRIQESQKWWKGQNWRMIQDDGVADGVQEQHRNTKWLWNSIVGKHADAMDSYPEPIFLPRAEDDKEEAENLTSVVPVILEQNGFEATYSDDQWQKMIEGTAAYSVTWDSHKFHGLGDVSISKVNVLNLFWEPGVNNIQESTNVFHVALIDNELLSEMYPQLRGHLGQPSEAVNRYPTDDHVDTSDKSLVIDWYYHRYDQEQDRQVLHFVKFCNGIVLYATEDDQGDPSLPEAGIPARDGLYNDGQFPFVLDPLYPVEGSPCGYGYIDIAKDIQTDIDLISEACVLNAAVNARPRYAVREDSGINEAEFQDLRQTLIHFHGNLDQNSFFQIQTSQVGGNTVGMLQQKIEELKFVTGNSDVNNGATPAGVTAAAAIQALKEDSGRSSKDSNRAAFRAYKEIVGMVIERIRQFYNQERIFRIKGQDGSTDFVTFSNAGLVPQYQGNDFGIDMGYRVPEFDIEVHVQREDAYTRLSQNELAIQMYQMGIFNPQMAPMASQMLEMMDFKGKDELVAKIRESGDLANMLSQVLQIAYEQANQLGDQQAAAQLAAIGEQMGMPLQIQAPQGGALQEEARHETDPSNGDGKASLQTRQDTILQKASERAQSATRPT